MSTKAHLYDSSRFRLIFDLDGGCQWRRLRDNATSRRFESEREARSALARESESVLFEEDEYEYE